MPSLKKEITLTCDNGDVYKQVTEDSLLSRCLEKTKYYFNTQEVRFWQFNFGTDPNTPISVSVQYFVDEKSNTEVNGI